jgi:integrase/recombinase XerD
LLSIKAGLRAKEICGLTWDMVTGADGAVGDAIDLENRISKGQGGGRTIPMNATLRAMLAQLHQERGEQARAGRAVIYSERGGGLTANTMTVWFHTLYHTLGLTGCSSHSGRRTFITRAARKVAEAGGSLRDVQQLAGHASLSMTQRYVEGDTDAKRKLVNLI